VLSNSFPETNFDDLFSRAMRDLPSETALVFPNIQFTFSDLNSLTSESLPGLLELLRLADVSHLPLIVDTSPESYLAVLTCVRFGVPCGLIDGSSPAGRVRNILQLWGSPKTAWIGPFVNHHSVLFPLTEREEANNSKRRDIGNSNQSAQSLVITTSGSTGFPKGVEIPFSTLMVRAKLDFDDEEYSDGRARLSNISPLHFIGGLNRFTKIFAGHELHVFDMMALGTKGLLKELERARLTHLSLPPQVGRLLAGYANPDEVFLETVQQLRMGSEGVRFEVLQGLKRYLPLETVFSHGLGATEGRRAFRWKSKLSEIPDTGQVPLGRPETRTKLTPAAGFDNGLQEVWVSETIASGYLSQPDLTEQRFVTDERGQQWWRSGDLVEQGQDGLFYHRGRIDDVVKVRGILASPSETTRALLDIPGIRMAVTLPRLRNGNTRLEAHIEWESATTRLSMSEIMAHLSLSLPAHLRPAEITVHDPLPTNSRGKVDRVKLLNIEKEG